MTEKLYLYVYILCATILGVATILTGKSYGETNQVQLDSIIVVLLLIIYILAYLLLYHFYYKTQFTIPHIKGFPKFYFTQKIHVLVFSALMFKLFGLLAFNIGSSERNVTTLFSILFNLVKIEEFFPIYYVVSRKTNNKFYWFNLLVFAVLRILQGWTGWILTITILELFLQENEYKGVYIFLSRHSKALLASIAIISGGLIYYFAYPLKNYIRFGGNINYYSLSIEGAVYQLVSRMTSFPVFTAMIQYGKKTIQLYRTQGVFLCEFKSLFRPLIPAFIFRNKDFRVITNLILQAQWPNISNETGTNIGLAGYWILLLRCDVADFVFCLAITLGVLLLIFSIFDAFDDGSHNVRILYFLQIMAFGLGGSLEATLSNGYFGAFYMLLILIIFGGVKIGESPQSFR